MSYPVLAPVSEGYPKAQGRLLTCYSPVRRSSTPKRGLSARLACVKHAASVRPEPGSNSPTKTKFVKKQSRQTKNIRQNTSNPTKKQSQTNNNWHWLTKHPVEFSKNNHTPENTETSPAGPGALVLHYCLVPAVSTGIFRFVPVRSSTPPYTSAQHRCELEVERFGRTAAAV